MSGRKTTYIDNRRQREAVERERLARHRRAIEQARRQAEALVADSDIAGFISVAERQVIRRQMDALGQIDTGSIADAPMAEARAAEAVREVSMLLGPARQRCKLAEQAERLRARLGSCPREAALRPRFGRLQATLGALLERLTHPVDDGIGEVDAMLPAALETEHRTLLALDAEVAEMRRFCTELRRRADWSAAFVADVEQQLQHRLNGADALTVSKLGLMRERIYTAAEAAFERHLVQADAARERAVADAALRRTANRARYLALSDEVAAIDDETRRLCPVLLAETEQELTRLRAAIDAQQQRFDAAAALLRRMLADLPALRERAASEVQARREQHQTALMELKAMHGALLAGLNDAELRDAARRHAEHHLTELRRSLEGLATRAGEQGLDQAIGDLRTALADFDQGQRRKEAAEQIRRLLLAADAIGRIRLDTKARDDLQVGLGDHVEIRAVLADSGEVLQMVVLQSEDGRLELVKQSDDEDAGCEVFVDIAWILADAIGQPLAIIDDTQGLVEVPDDAAARRRRESLSAKALDF